MSIPNEKLQQLLQEIEQKAQASQQQIAVVKAQIQDKQRQKRMIQLTTNELAQLPADANVYEGVGKMFVLMPNDELKEKLATQQTELKSDEESLGKKLDYLEKTAKNSKEHIDQLLNSSGRG